MRAISSLSANRLPMAMMTQAMAVQKA